MKDFACLHSCRRYVHDAGDAICVVLDDQAQRTGFIDGDGDEYVYRYVLTGFYRYVFTGFYRYVFTGSYRYVFTGFVDGDGDEYVLIRGLV